MKLKSVICFVGLSLITPAQATDFLNREITSVYVRNQAPKGVYIDISPAPENCGTGTDYLISNDTQWDDYTKAMYSYVLAANMAQDKNLQIDIDCSSNPKKIIRIKKNT